MRPLPDRQRRPGWSATALAAGWGHSHRCHRRRMQMACQGQNGHHRRQVGPYWRRSHPQAPRPHRQWRLQRLLALLPAARTPARTPQPLRAGCMTNSLQESRTRPDLGVRRKGVDLGGHVGRAGRRRDVGVLVETGRRQQPADRGQLVVGHVIASAFCMLGGRAREPAPSGPAAAALPRRRRRLKPPASPEGVAVSVIGVLSKWSTDPGRTDLNPQCNRLRQTYQQTSGARIAAEDLDGAAGSRAEQQPVAGALSGLGRNLVRSAGGSDEGSLDPAVGDQPHERDDDVDGDRQPVVDERQPDAERVEQR
jgi:hypothetical protein